MHCTAHYYLNPNWAGLGKGGGQNGNGNSAWHFGDKLIMDTNNDEVPVALRYQVTASVSNLR